MAGEEDWLGMLEREDVDGFNNRRTERSRPEIFAADLAGKNLAGVDLSNANLEKSDLTEADLTDANLLKANLAGIDGSGMKLTDVLGLRSRFKEAWMDGADLTGADLAQSDFADANLERSTGRGVRFAQARLRGVNAAGCSWPEADLSEGKLHQANFRGADLKGADLTEASAAEADLSEAVLDGIVGIGAKLPSAKLVGAKLAGARLVGANLSGADLTGADLAAADLTRANLAGADLRNAVLRGAVLADANLDGAQLAGADLSGADLTGLDPAALGLDGATVAGLAGFGVEFDASAPIRIAKPSVAAQGDTIALVWDNPEGDAPADPEDEESGPKTSVRFAVWRPRAGWISGAVPVPGDQVLDRQVVAVPGGFRVVVTRDRPEGAVVVLYGLGTDGALGSARTVPLGYDPVVRPVLRAEGDRLLQWGLARRGPTLVVHDLSGEEPRPVRSDTLATAVGFLGSYPVLACKGGVVVPAGVTGPAPPRRTPDGFPGNRALALTLGDDVLAVWAAPRAGDLPGGMRFSLIGRRHAPREEVLGLKAGVLAICARRLDEERAEVFWAEAGEHGRGPTTIWRAVVPSDDAPAPIGGPEDVTELIAGPGVLAAVQAGGRFALLDSEDGTVRAEFGD